MMKLLNENSIIVSFLLDLYFLSVFSIAVTGKILGFADFQITIQKILKTSILGIKSVCIFIIILELIIVFSFFISKKLHFFTYILIAVTLILFSLVIFYVIFTKNAVRCNCFGITNEYISLNSLFRNIFMLLLAFFSVFLYNINSNNPHDYVFFFMLITMLVSVTYSVLLHIRYRKMNSSFEPSTIYVLISEQCNLCQKSLSQYSYLKSYSNGLTLRLRFLVIQNEKNNKNLIQQNFMALKIDFLNLSHIKDIQKLGVRPNLFPYYWATNSVGTIVASGYANVFDFAWLDRLNNEMLYRESI